LKAAIAKNSLNIVFGLRQATIIGLEAAIVQDGLLRARVS
jgi:hypothetical protein